MSRARDALRWHCLRPSTSDVIYPFSIPVRANPRSISPHPRACSVLLFVVMFACSTLGTSGSTKQSSLGAVSLCSFTQPCPADLLLAVFYFEQRTLWNTQ